MVGTTYCLSDDNELSRMLQKQHRLVTVRAASYRCLHLFLHERMKRLQTKVVPFTSSYGRNGDTWR
jgi:hypothetical protein